MRGRRQNAEKESVQCLSLGPREREEQDGGETAGGSMEEIIAITSPTELAPRWKQDRWGPSGQPRLGQLSGKKPERSPVASMVCSPLQARPWAL